MRVSARRMNDLWGRMGLALLFCALLLNGVLCQDDADPAASEEPPRGDDVVTAAPDGDPQTPIEISVPTDIPAAGDAGDAADTSATAAPDSTDGGAVDQPADTDATAAPGAPDAPDTGATAAAPAGDADQATQAAPAPTPDNHDFIVNSQINWFLPDPTDAPVVVEVTEDPEPISVKCVSQHADPILKVELASAADCETIKAAVEEQICKDKKICKISIVQEGEVLTLAGLTVDENKNEVMQSLSEGELKEKLGVLKTEPVAQQGSNVLVAILVTGLLLAAALIGGYIWLNRRRGNGKGMRLAEDSYPVDEENQGNTLVSVAPLNPPEPQEKPSINGGGEAPADGVKTQAPAATNGHSTAKTPVADTEL